MCGRYSLTRKPAFQVGNALVSPGPFEAREQIAPTQRVLIFRNEPGGPVARNFRWGLTPEWAKPADTSRKIINIRSESVTEKFRNQLAHQRCLIPADGFYEWQKMGRHKQPAWFRLLSEEPFFFAGIYEEHRDQECAILTTAPNPLVSKIHNRMPVILGEQDADAWLNEPSALAVCELLRPYPSEAMKMDYIGSQVQFELNLGF